MQHGSIVFTFASCTSSESERGGGEGDKARDIKAGTWFKKWNTPTLSTRNPFFYFIHSGHTKDASLSHDNGRGEWIKVIDRNVTAPRHKKKTRCICGAHNKSFYDVKEKRYRALITKLRKSGSYRHENMLSGVFTFVDEILTLFIFLAFGLLIAEDYENVCYFV